MSTSKKRKLSDENNEQNAEKKQKFESSEKPKLRTVNETSSASDEKPYECPCKFCVNYRKQHNKFNSSSHIYIKAPTTDIVSIQPWQGWGDIDKCKMCSKGYFSLTFEVTYIENGKQYYYSEMCHPCLKQLVKKDPDSFTDKKRRPLLEMFNLIETDKSIEST